MRILTRRDMERWEAACRKVERMTRINQARRQTVTGWMPDEEDQAPIPTGRVAYTAADVQLTRDDCDKLVWYDSLAVGVPGVLKLPVDPVIGDMLWLVLFPQDVITIRPARNQGIYAPVINYVGTPSFVCGYFFDTESTAPGGSKHYVSDELQFAGIYSTLAITWVVMQYTGETKQMPTGYIDVNGNNPNPGDGNGAYYDAGIDTLTYSPITMWTVWRCRGRAPGHHRWKSEDFPY
jgi:hypothetical protein